HLGQVVHAEVVDRAPREQLERRVDAVSPEALAIGDANRLHAPVRLSPGIARGPRPAGRRSTEATLDLSIPSRRRLASPQRREHDPGSFRTPERTTAPRPRARGPTEQGALR